jgi:hypothetical protein
MTQPMFGSLSLIFDKMKAPAANMIVVLRICSLFSHSIHKVQGAVVNYQVEDANDLRNGKTVYYEGEKAFLNKVSILTAHAGYRVGNRPFPPGAGFPYRFWIGKPSRSETFSRLPWLRHRLSP